MGLERFKKKEEKLENSKSGSINTRSMHNQFEFTCLFFRDKLSWQRINENDRYG